MSHFSKSSIKNKKLKSTAPTLVGYLKAQFGFTALSSSVTNKFLDSFFPFCPRIYSKIIQCLSKSLLRRLQRRLVSEFFFLSLFFAWSLIFVHSGIKDQHEYWREMFHLCGFDWSLISLSGTFGVHCFNLLSIDLVPSVLYYWIFFSKDNLHLK